MAVYFSIPNLQIWTLHKIKCKKFLTNEQQLNLFNEQIR